MFFSTSFVKNLVRSAFDVVGFEITRRPNTITLPFIKKLTLSDASLSDKFKMYHVGCGPLIADGFLNIDGNFESINQIRQLRSKAVNPMLLKEGLQLFFYSTTFEMAFQQPLTDSKLYITHISSST